MKNTLLLTATIAGLALFAGANTASAGHCYPGYGGFRTGYGVGYGGFGVHRGYAVPSYGYRSYGYGHGIGVRPVYGYGHRPIYGGYGRRGGVNVRIGW